MINGLRYCFGRHWDDANTCGCFTIFYKTSVRCLHRVLKQYHLKDRNLGFPDIISATFNQYHNSTLFRFQIINMDPV